MVGARAAQAHTVVGQGCGVGRALTLGNGRWGAGDKDTEGRETQCTVSGVAVGSSRGRHSPATCPLPSPSLTPLGRRVPRQTVRVVCLLISCWHPRLLAATAGKSLSAYEDNGFDVGDDLDQAVGLQHAELVADLQDKPFFQECLITGPFGTAENPVKIESTLGYRIVGCTGGFHVAARILCSSSRAAGIAPVGCFGYIRADCLAACAQGEKATRSMTWRGSSCTWAVRWRATAAGRSSSWWQRHLHRLSGPCDGLRRLSPGGKGTENEGERNYYVIPYRMASVVARTVPLREACRCR